MIRLFSIWTKLRGAITFDNNRWACQPAIATQGSPNAESLRRLGMHVRSFIVKLFHTLSQMFCALHECSFSFGELCQISYFSSPFIVTVPIKINNVNSWLHWYDTCWVLWYHGWYIYYIHCRQMKSGVGVKRNFIFKLVLVIGTEWQAWISYWSSHVVFLCIM